MDNFKFGILLGCWLGTAAIIQQGFHDQQNSPVCEHARAALDAINYRAAEKKSEKTTIQRASGTTEKKGNHSAAKP